MTEIAPHLALAHLRPDLFDELQSDMMRAIWLSACEDTLRSDQLVPHSDFSSFGVIAGRGWGKTRGIAVEVNRRVRAGARHVALIAPTADRVKDVQIASLIELAPLDFAPVTWRDTVVWPNGVVAEVFTPEAPGRSRSSNLDLTWMTEIVDWNPNTALESYHNLVTATRRPGAVYLWDTTSKGQNSVISHLLSQAARDPERHIVRRGTMFDNPVLGDAYLKDQAAMYAIGSRRYDEEVLGLVYSESAGALWRQDWIDQSRVVVDPVTPDLTVIALDPALSKHKDADDTGLVLASRDRAGDVYVLRDLSGRLSPQEAADLIVRECQRDCAGVVLERNHTGDWPGDTIRVVARERGMVVESIPSGKPFPSRRPGTIWLREVVATRDKESRASAPAALYQRGRVHHVGHLRDLELEVTTWEPGSRRSPNRLDALSMVINELAGLVVPDRRKSDVRGAAQVQHALAQGLRCTPRGRGI